MNRDLTLKRVDVSADFFLSAPRTNHLQKGGDAQTMLPAYLHANALQKGFLDSSDSKAPSVINYIYIYIARPPSAQHQLFHSLICNRYAVVAEMHAHESRKRDRNTELVKIISIFRSVMNDVEQLDVMAQTGCREAERQRTENQHKGI